MDAPAILYRLRTGQPLSNEELAWFARGLADGSVGDAQAGAFAMAVCLNGLSEAERVGLTLAMRDSGHVMAWSLPGPAIDKHSTGGIGDAVSLILAPALAACGAYVPMISGRGLGHTGGTLDKLEAIPGLSTEVSETRFREIVEGCGAAIVAATAELAPADRRLYAIRDITSTVESIDLITASILSKKLAAGLEALVLDVKVGSGAFMATMEEARALAQSLVRAANGAGCPTRALITDMDQPLARAAGNALEVAEVMAVLTEGAGGRLRELSERLSGELLALAGLAASAEEGAARAADAIASGAAAERFGQMVAALGGPADFLQNWRTQLPAAAVVREVPAPRAGYVAAIDGRALGNAVVRLGGGRLVAGQKIDPAVGLSDLALLGEHRAEGEPLACVHAASEEAAARAAEAVATAYGLAETPPALPPLVHERIA
jgi:thymidine phosphorylase